MSGWTRVPTTYGVYKVKKVAARSSFDAYGKKRTSGAGWVVMSPDGGQYPYASRAAALASLSSIRKRNPTHRSGRAQQREATRKRAVERRVATALSKYLKQVNPSAKLAGAKVEKLKGGVLKITPIKANAGKRDHGIYPKYVVYPGGVPFKSKITAVREARAGGASYVTNQDTGRVVWQRRAKH